MYILQRVVSWVEGSLHKDRNGTTAANDPVSVSMLPQASIDVAKGK